jgi:hypothetical protein
VKYGENVIQPNTRYTGLSRRKTVQLLTVVVGGAIGGSASAVLDPLIGVDAPAGAALTSRAAIVNAAAGEVGYGASPGQCQKYASMCADWCAMFAIWCWRTAGVTPLPDTFVARGVGAWGQGQHAWKWRPPAERGDPRPGDIVVYGAPGYITGGHVSIVESVNADGTITTIDGNFNNRVVRRIINPLTARAGGNSLPIGGYVAPPNAMPAVYGGIAEKFWSLGGLGSFLREPVSIELDTPAVAGGRWQKFEGGAIYWHATTGAHETHGAIQAKYHSIGSENFFGLPLIDESAARAPGRFQQFARGYIFWHPSYGAHPVLGAMRTLYDEINRENGFGFPTSDEDDAANGGRFQVFEQGLMLWRPENGAHTVRGAILVKFREAGSESGMGYPQTEEMPFSTDGKYQRFDNGTIYWRPTQGSWIG